MIKPLTSVSINVLVPELLSITLFLKCKAIVFNTSAVIFVVVF